MRRRPCRRPVISICNIVLHLLVRHTSLRGGFHRIRRTLPIIPFQTGFRGFLRIFLGICVHSFLYDSSRSCQRLRHHASILTQFGMIVNRFVKIHQSKNRFVKIHQSNPKTQDVFGSFRGSVSCRPRLWLPSANNDRLSDTAALKVNWKNVIWQRCTKPTN